MVQVVNWRHGGASEYQHAFHRGYDCFLLRFSPTFALVPLTADDLDVCRVLSVSRVDLSERSNVKHARKTIPSMFRLQDFSAKYCLK